MFNLKKLTKKEWLLIAKNFLLIVVGTAILAFGVSVFILPFELVTGGVPGIAVIINRLIPIEFITEAMWVTIITWVLFFIGWILLGKSFALKTLTSTIVYSIVVNVAGLLVSPDVLNGFFYLQGSKYNEIAIVLAAVFGGACVGAGCAITFLGGGSTGGVDILSLAISKYFPKIESSTSIFIIDGGLVLLGMFILNDFVLTLLGIVSAFICALIVDYLFVGKSKEFVAFIVSSSSDEINKQIIEKMDRTTTYIKSKGGYSQKEIDMLMVSFTMNEYNKLLSIVSIIDKNAFVTISRAHEINGKGFTLEKIN
ncbi:MAG: YitT family protein [Erysipelotrichaceae bacterium]|nr:YitT family protein [Erysipelotrichaceae bacterium]